MAGLIANHPWCHTPLGGRESWPQSLKTAVEMMLYAAQPAVIAWGPSLTALYNDACIPLLEERHPASLGGPYHALWPDRWDDLKPVVQAALAGEPRQLVGQRLPHSTTDERANWFTWVWMPLRDDAGRIAGLYCTATETTLRFGDEQLRTILENTQEGVFMIDLQSRKYVYASPAMTALTGFSADELRAMPTEERIERTHPDDRRAVRAEVDGLIAQTAAEAVVEERWRVKSGEYRWFAVSGKVVRDPSGQQFAIVGVCRDVTAQKQNEEALRQSQTRLALALDIARMALWEWDINSDAAVWNDRLFQILGLPHTDHPTGAMFMDLVHPDDLEDLTKSIQSAIGSRAEWRGEFRILRPDGEIRWLSAIGHFLHDADGKPHRMVGVNFDISEQRQAEAALLDSERRYRQLQEELIHVGRVSELSQVSAGIAHELNQPLAAMLNYTATAKRLSVNKDEASIAAARNFIAKAGEQAERAAEIIRRMRDFVEKSVTRRERCAINAVVEDAVALGLIGAKAGGIDTRLDLSPGLPDVYVDRLQIQQVLVNLLRNAIDAMSQAERRELVLTTARRGDDVEVSVSDSGCGIPQHMREKLFQPFVTTKAGGMGIGLAISQSIIEAHQGSVVAEPNPEGGTIFRFCIPPSGP